MGTAKTDLYQHKKSFAWKLFILILTGSVLMGFGNGHYAQAKENMMMTKQMTIWEVIDNIADYLPLKRKKIEKLFGVTLKKSESSNQYWTFWEGAGDLLQNDVHISRIILGVQNSDENLGSLSLTITDSCIKLEQVKQKYDLQLSGVPRGRSLDEETTYKSTTSWGHLVFGFAERNRVCLSSIGFGTTK
jgi:hypothetical protein